MMQHPNNQAAHGKQRAQSNPKGQGNNMMATSGTDGIGPQLAERSAPVGVDRGVTDHAAYASCLLQLVACQDWRQAALGGVLRRPF